MITHKPGASCIVDPSKIDAPVEMIAPALEAAILARRAERAPADDIARAAALKHKTAIDRRLARLIAAETERRAR